MKLLGLLSAGMLGGEMSIEGLQLQKEAKSVCYR
jgi:hypothetical protein